MKKLIVIAMMAVVVTAYKNARRNNAGSAFEEFPPYQRTRQHPLLYEQHHPFREQLIKTQQYQSHRRRPNRQDLFPYLGQQSFGDQSLLKGHSSDLKRHSSFFPDGILLRNVHDKDGMLFGKEQIIEDQTNDQQALRDDFRFADLFDKTTGSLKGQSGQLQSTGSFIRDPEYLKHGNHGLGYVSMPAISPYENVLALNEEASTTMTPSMAPTSTHQPLLQTTVSNSASAISQVHTSTTFKPKMASLKASYMATMPTVKSDTLADAGTTSPSTTAVSTMVPLAPITVKQSSNLAHPTALTTEASIPVMPTESPIISFGQTIPPIEFPAAKFIAPASHYYLSNGLKNTLQQSLLSYLTSQQLKSPDKTNGSTALLDNALNNNLITKLQSPALSYTLPEESKITLKDNLQIPLLNYLLQQESNRALPVAHTTIPETVNYIPLESLVDKPKLVLPTVPIATLSAVSRPLQTINYASTTLPRVSALPLGLSSNVADGQATGLFNSLPGGIGGISAGIPTLNFGQNFQHAGQLRQFQVARNQPYSAGLQLQLGGFEGIDYSLRSSNPTLRPTDLGIAKVGLSLPELPRHQLATFPKVGFGQHLL
ncbi:PREDICTED: uncharacterized protein LOC108580256 [Habropoda laboriosa]|uniref:uncharacterized protein LOC108580256 n=1 Tax=Habropoda laboriosa TaxID=597456 RepID=UPI00083E1110|nr:PREDICTED: uncharacterized protein LOC108580256 [Habropoda laboriosa]